MEPIRYKPGEAIRWLETGAEANRKSARLKGRDVFAPGVPPGAKLGQGVGALIDLGKSAWADVLHKQAEASEYVFQEDRFDVVSGNSIKTVPYDEIKRISFKNERATITLHRGSTLVIKPYAHISAGRIRVPVGWLRNGMEVPYDLLIEELSARCGVEVEAA
ncbi:MAG: hypothetical protein ACHQ50_11450 [Fimbriimonadales bacterium]